MAITRNEFLKCCAAGVCSCVTALPEAATAETSNAEIEQLHSQLEGARIRYAKLVSILEENLDEATRKRVFDSLGRECTGLFRSRTFDKYKGDLAGFLKSVEGPDGWAVKTEYDEKAGVIRVFDRGPHCSCPLVKEGLTSGAPLRWHARLPARNLLCHPGTSSGWSCRGIHTARVKRCVFRMTVLG